LSKITNPKHQITNKHQISNYKQESSFKQILNFHIQTKICKRNNLFVILNFGHCDLFVFCDLLFGILNILGGKPKPLPLAQILF